MYILYWQWIIWSISNTISCFKIYVLFCINYSAFAKSTIHSVRSDPMAPMGEREDVVRDEYLFESSQWRKMERERKKERKRNFLLYRHVCFPECDCHKCPPFASIYCSQCTVLSIYSTRNSFVNKIKVIIAQCPPPPHLNPTYPYTVQCTVDSRQ